MIDAALTLALSAVTVVGLFGAVGCCMEFVARLVSYE